MIRAIVTRRIAQDYYGTVTQPVVPEGIIFEPSWGKGHQIGR
jgi:hypothetical protein